MGEAGTVTVDIAGERGRVGDGVLLDSSLDLKGHLLPLPGCRAALFFLQL
jgi:hypothetical protein